MANLGDTYLKSLEDKPMYCILKNNCCVCYFTTLELAEDAKKRLNLTTDIWIDGEENPNIEFIEAYNSKFKHKLQPDFSQFTGLTDYEIRIMAHDKHLCRYSKHGY